MKKKKAVSALSGPSCIVSVDSEPFLCLFIGTLMFVFLYPDLWLSFSCQFVPHVCPTSGLVDSPWPADGLPAAAHAAACYVAAAAAMTLPAVQD